MVGYLITALEFVLLFGLARTVLSLDRVAGADPVGTWIAFFFAAVVTTVIALQ